MKVKTTHPLANLAIGPAPHRVSRALRARNPGRVRKESGKEYPGHGQKCPKSAPRSLERVRKESESQILDSFRTLSRLRGALFGNFWGPAPGYSFRTLSGLFRGSGPEGPGRPCVGRGRSQSKSSKRNGFTQFWVVGVGVRIWWLKYVLLCRA